MRIEREHLLHVVIARNNERNRVHQAELCGLRFLQQVKAPLMLV